MFAGRKLSEHARRLGRTDSAWRQLFLGPEPVLVWSEPRVIEAPQPPEEVGLSKCSQLGQITEAPDSLHAADPPEHEWPDLPGEHRPRQGTEVTDLAEDGQGDVSSSVVGLQSELDKDVSRPRSSLESILTVD